MFGYIKPFKPELKFKEYELYKGIYCSICKCLSKKFGLFSKFTLSYDSVFLALLYFSLSDSSLSLKNCHCSVNPLKKCLTCQDFSDEIIFSSATCIILAYYKLLDDVYDSKNIQKLKAYSLIPFFKKPYKKAKCMFPVLDDMIGQQMSKQQEIEHKNDTGLDKAADPTALMLSNITALLPILDDQIRVLKEFSYFLGRWIYLIDAVDDFHKDKKCNNFNPFILQLNNQRNLSDEVAFQGYMTQVLNQTLARVLAAYNLMKINKFKSIMDNIIILGLMDTQKNVLKKVIKND